MKRRAFHIGPIYAESGAEWPHVIFSEVDYQHVFPVGLSGMVH